MIHSDNHRYPASDTLNNELLQLLLLFLRQQVPLRRVGQSDQTVRPRLDTEFDQPLLTAVVDRALPVETGGQDRETPLRGSAFKTSAIGKRTGQEPPATLPSSSSDGRSSRGW